jgi:NADH:ubiquinone oxidoreductase subunit 2 (subunit N)
MASLISYFYYLRVVIVMYMRPAASEDAHRGLAVSGPAAAAIGIAAIAVLALFFFAAPVLDLTQQSVATLFVPTQAFFGLQP